MKISWRKCLEFSSAAQSYLTRTKDAETKLAYAIRRVTTRMQKLGEQVNEALTDIDIDFCEVSNDVITRDAQGNLQYKKETLKARNKEKRDYINKEDLDLEPYFATSIPDSLNEFEIEAFSGIVIAADEAERLLSRLGSGEQCAVLGSNGDQALAAVQ